MSDEMRCIYWKKICLSKRNFKLIVVQDIAKKNLNPLSAWSTETATLKLVGCEFNVSSFFVYFYYVLYLFIYLYFVYFFFCIVFFCIFPWNLLCFISTFSALWKSFELFLILCRIKKKDMNYLQHDIFFFTDLLNCSSVRRIIGKPATNVNNRIFCSI